METVDIIEREESMSQTQTPPSSVTQELITALASLGIGGGNNPKLDSILERLDRKSAKEEAKELEEIELAKRGREANIRDVKLRHENERLKRLSCSHRNEHNRTNVRGQRDHDLRLQRLPDRRLRPVGDLHEAPRARRQSRHREYEQRPRRRWVDDHHVDDDDRDARQGPRGASWRRPDLDVSGCDRRGTVGWVDGHPAGREQRWVDVGHLRPDRVLRGVMCERAN